LLYGGMSAGEKLELRDLLRRCIAGLSPEAADTALVDLFHAADAALVDLFREIGVLDDTMTEMDVDHPYTDDTDYLQQKADDTEPKQTEEARMLPLQALARLVELLPKLSAVTPEWHRLKVLSDIDRVLAAKGLTWADFAEALSEAGGSLPVAELLTIIEHIEQHRTLLTDNACSFLADLREKAAAQADEVRLTVRQGQWLYELLSQAAGHLSFLNE
jgi:hypothetical protein